MITFKFKIEAVCACAGRVSLTMIMKTLCCLFLLLSSVNSVEAQSGRTAKSVGERSATTLPKAGGAAGIETDEDVIDIRTTEVLLPVSVREADGRLKRDLAPENFLIYDNGVRQEITSFNKERVPINVVLLLDASGSVYSQMSFIRKAAIGFVHSLTAEDKVSVMQFADRVELLQDWTPAGDTKGIDKALQWRYHPGERTTFYDGLYLAADEQLKKVQGRRIVVLLTDGIDSSERKRVDFTQALNAIRRSETIVYTISLTESLRRELDEKTGGRVNRLLMGGYNKRLIAMYRAQLAEAEANLKQLASQSGGRVFFPLEQTELAGVYQQIAEELRTQYLITYRPTPRSTQTQWREIRVLVTPGGYDVSARREYLSGI